jgi:hypothetical protein
MALHTTATTDHWGSIRAVLREMTLLVANTANDVGRIAGLRRRRALRLLVTVEDG